MPHHRGETRLGDEHPPELRILEEVRVSPLDRYRSMKPGRPSVKANVDGSHPSTCDLEDRAIAPRGGSLAVMHRHLQEQLRHTSSPLRGTGRRHNTIRR